MSFLGNYTERTFPSVVSPEDARKRVADGIADNDTVIPPPVRPPYIRPSSPELELIGERLTALRRGMNLSTDQVQAITGIHRECLDAWEAGNAFPTLDKLITLCQLYGVTPDRIMGVNAPNPPADAASAAADMADCDLYLDHLRQIMIGLCVHLQAEHNWSPARIAEASRAMVDQTNCLDPDYSRRIAEAVQSLAADSR